MLAFRDSASNWASFLKTSINASYITLASIPSFLRNRSFFWLSLCYYEDAEGKEVEASTIIVEELQRVESGSVKVIDHRTGRVAHIVGSLIAQNSDCPEGTVGDVTAIVAYLFV